LAQAACEPYRIGRKPAVSPGYRFAFKGHPDQERMVKPFSRPRLKQSIEIQSVEWREDGHQARS